MGGNVRDLQANHEKLAPHENNPLYGIHTHVHDTEAPDGNILVLLKLSNNLGFCIGSSGN